MPRLRYLNLYANRLIGSIPLNEISSYNASSSLESLNLDSNFLSGPLVSEIGLLSTLTHLNIGFNDFDRKLPTEIGNLSLLKELVITGNSFSGRLPSEIGQLSNTLEVLLMDQNLFFGSIPVQYYSQLSKLRDFNLAGSGTGGTLPSEIGLALSNNLERLDLRYNNFVGTIPSEIGLLTKLGILLLENNDFTGSMPNEVCNNTFDQLVVDCYDSISSKGVQCDIPSCCSFCRKD